MVVAADWVVSSVGQSDAAVNDDIDDAFSGLLAAI